MSGRNLHFSAFAMFFVSVAAYAGGSQVVADPAIAAKGGHQGAAALWGGRIVAKTKDHGETCIEVAAYPLRRSDGRPLTQSGPGGQHFLACHASAFESGDYSIGKQATVAGVVGPLVERGTRVSCGPDADVRDRLENRGNRADAANRCDSPLPTLTVTDSRAWPEPPTRSGSPVMM